MKWLVGFCVLAAACGDNLAGSGGGDDGGGSGDHSCLPDCQGARTYDATSYHLTAHYDWTSHQLVATEKVVLDVSASGPIVELDAAMAVTAVHLPSNGASLPYKLDTTAQTLTVDLTGVPDGTFELDYTAAPSTSLIETASRDDDPVTSKVVYTDSEPNRALWWLAVKLDPSDRALFSSDLTVAATEDVIANGERTGDTTTGGQRTVSHALDKPIPAYLMAFALGELAHTDRATGSLVPLSVWYRKGFVLDAEAHLDQIADAMATFESLVGPYPWARYSVVLLPYGGGMENATITFDNETSGQTEGQFSLVAHELAHHWFGDWVTMHGYDDVWFKEGMATVLESVADQARRDKAGLGRDFGLDFSYWPNDAIVDPDLHGLDKYTTGPYQHAAWLIAQIRGQIGDDAFWAGLQKLLADHPAGSATGEDFLRSFVDLDEATVQKLLAGLTTKQTPHLAVTVGAPAAGATPVSIALTDPTGLMLDPIHVAVIDNLGTVTTTTVQIGAAASNLSVPAGGYLTFDEVDRTPSLTTDYGVDPTTNTKLRALFAPAPTAPPAIVTMFENRSAAQQERAAALPLALATQWSAYYAALDSNRAQANAIVQACTKGQTDALWMTAVDAQLQTPPREVFDPRLVACGTGKATAFAAQIHAALASGDPAALARVQYLMSFDFGDSAIDVLGEVVKTAPQLVLRDLALTRLVYELENYVDYTPVSAAVTPAWQALFEGELAATMSDNRFDDVVGALGALHDGAAMAKVGMVIHDPYLSGDSQVYATCTAFGVATGADLAAFEAAAMPYNTLDPRVATIIAGNGSGCGGNVRARISHAGVTRGMRR